MLLAFTIFAITASPISSEVADAANTCEQAIADANADPSTIDANRALCASKFEALDAAIAGAGLIDPMPYQLRAQSAWFVLDASIAVQGQNPIPADLRFGSPPVEAALSDVKRLRYEVAQKLANEA